METRTGKPCRWRHVEAVVFWLLMLAPLISDPWGGGFLVSQFKATHINMLACVLACVFLFRSFFKCGFRFIPSLVDLPLLCFLLLAGASIFWSINHSVHLQRYTLILSTCLCFYIIRIRMAEGDSLLKNIVFLLSVGALVALIDSSALLYRQFQAADVESLLGGGAPVFKVDSLFFPHDNVASIYIVVLVPLAYTLLFCVKSTWQRIACVLTLLLLLGYLILLKSRAALIEAALGILLISVCLMFRNKLVPFFRGGAILIQKKPVLMILAVVLLLILLLPLSSDFRAYAKAGFSWCVDFFGLQYERSYFRLDIWKKTMAMASDHILLGVGLGNFPVVFPAYHKLELLKAHAHSEYYNILAELGILGLVFFLLFIVFLMRSFILAFQHGEGWERTISLGLGCALLIVGIHGFVEPPFIFEASSLTMLFCFGLLTSLESRVLKKPAAVPGAGGMVRRYVLPAIALIFACFTVPKLAMCYAQGPGYEKAMAAVNLGRFEEAEKIYRRISKLSFDSHVAHINIGDACFRQKKYEEAYREYLEAEALFPYFYKIHFNKGVTLLQLGRPQEAVLSLEECWKYNPGYKPREFWHIRALVDLKAYDLAFRRLDAYLRAKRPTREELKISGELRFRAYQCTDRAQPKRILDLKKAVEYFEGCLKLGGAGHHPDLELKIKYLRQLLDKQPIDKNH